jgi:Haem-binding domain
MTTLAKLAVAGVVAFGALQFVRPPIPARPAAAELQAPLEVKQILDKSCYSCHSDQVRLAWFDQIVPAYWLVRKDILAARKRLNFSTIGSTPTANQKGALYEGLNFIRLGTMPLPRFLALHPDRKVKPQQVAALESYLAPLDDPARYAACSPARGTLRTRVPG